MGRDREHFTRVGHHGQPLHHQRSGQTMERIGRISENPFEGKSIDVPITTISRGIEIDLREMLDESSASIPPPIEVQYDTQT